MTWWVKPLAVVLAVAALIGGYAWWRSEVANEAREAERQHVAALADLQREANRGRARDAAQRLSGRQQVVEKWFIGTVKEFENATVDLAAYAVPEPARSMLNDARQCAREAGSAACGGDGPVPSTR